MTTYRRTFHLQASHFNGQDAYDAYAAALNPDVSLDVRLTHALRCVGDQHGHNFAVTVEASATTTGMVVDDERLTALVSTWDNVCLSVLPEFNGTRATTEEMARILHRRCLEAFPDVFFTISVRETAQIEAVFP